jgi:hypothetical protein
MNKQRNVNNRGNGGLGKALDASRVLAFTRLSCFSVINCVTYTEFVFIAVISFFTFVLTTIVIDLI